MNRILAMAREAPNREQWAALRAEMARVSGAVVFVGGAKIEGNALIPADGVDAERAAADSVGAFLLPVGASGGAAEAIARELIGSSLADNGITARRPTDSELQTLIENKNPRELAALVTKILKRFSAGRG